VAHASSSSTQVAKAEGSQEKFDTSMSKTATPYLKGVLCMCVCVCVCAYIYIRNLHIKLEVTNYNFNSAWNEKEIIFLKKRSYLCSF
jgi:hypothetical protein